MRTLAEIGFTLLCLCAALYLGTKGAQGLWDVMLAGRSHDAVTPSLMALGSLVLLRVSESWSPSRDLVGY